MESLEKSYCIGENTGWKPHYILLENKKNVLSGILTFFVKFDSYGEYIFDWEWAGAFHQAGLSYFPKVVVAIPFTPANGVRFLLEKDLPLKNVVSIFLNVLMKFCEGNQISSIHFLCLTESEQCLLENFGSFFPGSRINTIGLTINYQSFQDFLDNIHSKRKKQIRKERDSLRAVGCEIQPAQGR